MKRISTTAGAATRMKDSYPVVQDSVECEAAAASPAVEALFPLQFTPFEYYYLLEDRPEHASTFPVRLQSRWAIRSRGLLTGLRTDAAAASLFCGAHRI